MPTRVELLADHFIRSAGIAGVSVDRDGQIAAVDRVGLFHRGEVILCCASGSEARVAARAAARMPAKCGHADALAAVHAAAAEAGIALTPFATVIQRALNALAIVDRTLDDMKLDGQLRDFNREFAQLRKANPKLRYQDHMHEKKLAMVEALARKAG
ncbi:hypothetical protein [Bradyrhizobium sp. USDA 4350]